MFRHPIRLGLVIAVGALLVVSVFGGSHTQAQPNSGTPVVGGSRGIG